MYKADGFTLLEVLISLVLISCLLSSFEAMQLYALRQTRAAYYFSVATDQLNSMAERLSVSRTSNEIDRWNEENQQLLPNGMGFIQGSYPTYQLKIVWGDMNNDCQTMQLGQSGCLTMDVTV